MDYEYWRLGACLREKDRVKNEKSLCCLFFVLSSLLPSSPSPCTDLQLVHSCSWSLYRSTLHASVFCWIHLNSRQSTVTVNCSSQAFAQSWQEHLDSWHSAKCFFLKIDIRWYLFVHVKHAASQTENYCNKHCVFSGKRWSCKKMGRAGRFWFQVPMKASLKLCAGV